MTQFKPIELKDANIHALNRWLDSQENVFPFSNNHNSSLLVCYILSQEIGGPNDDLPRFIYDVDQQQKIDRKNLNTQVGMFEDNTSPCVRITCLGSSRLSITIPDLQKVVTCNDHELIISPSAIAAYVRLQGLEPVFVKAWVQQTAFSTFNLKTDRLNGQLWVLRNNDSFLYSQLVSKRQVVFQSMHDIVGHIAGIKNDGFVFASEVASLIFNKLKIYFEKKDRGNLPSHLIPFLIGLLLDELTQKPFYFSTTRTLAIKELLNSFDEYYINPQEHLILKGFPKQITEILEMVRDQARFSVELLRISIKNLFQEYRDLIVPA